MKCTQCGYETDQSFQYCPNCGAVILPGTVSRNPAADKILGLLKDNLFLVICILVSVNCGLSVVWGNLPLLSILLTVFLWLTYAQSRKDIADPKYLRNISGTVYASYVITYVVYILLFVAGILISLVFDLIVKNPGEFYSYLEHIGEFDMEGFLIPGLSLAELILSISGWIIIAVVAVLCLIGILINAFGMRKIHRMVKSVYVSILSGKLQIEKANAAKNWLFVFGAFSALSAVSSLTGDLMLGLAEGCNAAAMILGGILVRKHLVTEELL